MIVYNMQKYEVPPPGVQVGMAPPPPAYQVGTAPPPPGYVPQPGFVQFVQAAPAQQNPQGYVTVQSGPGMAPCYPMGMQPSVGVNTSWSPQPQIVVASAQPQVMAAAAPPPMVVTSQPVIFLNTQSSVPVTGQCPQCHTTMTTNTSCLPGSSCWIAFAVLFVVWFFTGLPLCWIPFVIPSCYETKHRCGRCGAYLGKYNSC